MNIQKLKSIGKLYFGCEDIARVLCISKDSARVSASRYVKRGILLRLKRNLYVLADNWPFYTRDNYFSIANILQVPSYISLMTALEYYGCTTQVQRDVVESITLKRTVEYDVSGRLFLYTRIDSRLYAGFSLKNGYFIASAEKAFMDCLYLRSISRYRFDIDSIEFSKFNRKKIKELSLNYSEKTRVMLEEIWKT